MNTLIDQPPNAAPLRHGFRFEGSGGEYFKIWIVNLALSIATLGIFSAWAKVRSKRYFYGNTYIGEHNFDYHANPLRILVGRVIALTLLLGYSATNHFMPVMTFVWIVFFLFAMPWLLNASLRFNARNSSYRNIRFNFVGTYGGAFQAYVLWSLLAVITLLTTYPLARRARDQYNINNHTFGGKAFHAEIPGWLMYKAYLLGGLLFLCGIVIVICVLLGATLAGLDVKSADPKQPLTMLPMMLVIGVSYMFVLLFLTAFVGTRIFNLALNNTVLADKLRFESSLSALRMGWLVTSNLALTLITLGLYYPWARVRVARYTSENLAVIGASDLDGFSSELFAGQGAIGEEVANFFDVDVGL
ncbi:MAG TPA: YjgN family protein [Rhizomicrobium sp.]|nr:YjgN family protein [Rhizomicrobium sp.]